MKCSFCGGKFRVGGKMLVKTNGTILYFCSSKCEKNYSLGRSAKRLGWVRKART
jgi:large subunit ribosomal protein L24e